MRSEEWAKPTRVKNKHKVKVSTKRSDFAAEELARIRCRGEFLRLSENVVIVACYFDGRTVFAPTYTLCGD